MTRKSILARTATAAAAVAAALLLAGCAAKAPAPVTQPPAASEKKPAGVVLEYKMPAGQILKYGEEETAREVAEVMGQTRESLTTAKNAYAFRAKGRRGNDHLLEATIEDMSLGVTNADRDFSPDLGGVRGKSFDMVLSPSGSDVDVSGAEKITFEIANGPRSVASGFKLFFPKLPAGPIRIGDSWTSSSDVEDKSGASIIKIHFESVNTLEGFETVDGMECARIGSKITGTISGRGNQDGADLAFEGTIEGADRWRFAVKEGLYVDSTSESVTKMTVSVTGPADFTMPATQTRKGEVKLIGR
jgi:hypothetical protein